MPRNRQSKSFFELVAFVAFLPVFVVIWVVDRITDAFSSD